MNMKMKRIFCAILLAVLSATCALAGDTPENLNVIWARAAHDGTPIYASPSEKSKVVIKLDEKNDLLRITGERTEGSETWYEVSYYLATRLVEGWIKASDTWFSDVHDIGYFPKSHQLYDRLRFKLERYLGNYPELSRKLVGREFDSKFQAGGGVTVQTMIWRGLKMIYENSYKNPDGAWISYVEVAPGRTGNKVSFGPIRLGTTADEVRKILKDNQGFEYKYMDRSVKYHDVIDEVELPDGTTMIQLSTENYGGGGEVGNPYSFSFFIKDGKVVRMEHRWAHYE